MARKQTRRSVSISRPVHAALVEHLAGRPDHVATLRGRAKSPFVEAAIKKAIHEERSLWRGQAKTNDDLLRAPVPGFRRAVKPSPKAQAMAWSGAVQATKRARGAAKGLGKAPGPKSGADVAQEQAGRPRGDSVPASRAHDGPTNHVML